MDDGHRLFDETLRPGDFFSEILEIDRGLQSQGREMHIDADKSLDDLVMQFPADPLALLFLGQEKLAGQMPQLFLHVTRLLEQLSIVGLAFLEGHLRLPPLDNFPL